mmetsp:Transcript_18969/g.40753  ORF Transcript_18969/g.40753 Transcript_18969/m.40753 type:complete len:1467 (+) Transcript_18969:81-4481(+)
MRLSAPLSLSPNARGMEGSGFTQTQSPDGTQMIRNFAMSQSPPSHSPQRRFVGTQGDDSQAFDTQMTQEESMDLGIGSRAMPGLLSKRPSNLESIARNIFANVECTLGADEEEDGANRDRQAMEESIEVIEESQDVGVPAGENISESDRNEDGDGDGAEDLAEGGGEGVPEEEAEDEEDEEEAEVVAEEEEEEEGALERNDGDVEQELVEVEQYAERRPDISGEPVQVSAEVEESAGGDTDVDVDAMDEDEEGEEEARAGDAEVGAGARSSLPLMAGASMAGGVEVLGGVVSDDEEAEEGGFVIPSAPDAEEVPTPALQGSQPEADERTDRDEDDADDDEPSAKRHCSGATVQLGSTFEVTTTSTSFVTVTSASVTAGSTVGAQFPPTQIAESKDELEDEEMQGLEEENMDIDDVAAEEEDEEDEDETEGQEGQIEGLEQHEFRPPVAAGDAASGDVDMKEEDMVDEEECGAAEELISGVADELEQEDEEEEQVEEEENEGGEAPNQIETEEPSAQSAPTSDLMITQPGGVPQSSRPVGVQAADPVQEDDDDNVGDQPPPTFQGEWPVCGNSAASSSQVSSAAVSASVASAVSAAVASVGGQDSSTSLVAMDEEELAEGAGGQHPIVPLAANPEAFGGCLPPEAQQDWTVSGQTCVLSSQGQELLRLPRQVHDRLYNYQRQGLVWMWNLFKRGMGGILADEMGLGKTVQAAAFLACLKYTNLASTFMVVAPVTLLEQWKRELQEWSKQTGLETFVMQGTQQERKNAMKKVIARGGVLLVSYDLVRTCGAYLRTAGLAAAAVMAAPKKRKRQNKRGCRDDDSPSEAEDEIPADAPVSQDANTPWDVLFVDEGQQIKNPSSSAGRALRRIEAKSRFLLSGTPLQNKLSDLWALMDFVQPGLLGNHATFERNFSEQIARGSKRNATPYAVELKDNLARELKKLTAPHFLRRMKNEVAKGDDASQADAAPKELPPKVDVVLWLSLTAAQQELYALSLTSDIVKKATAAAGGKCGMEALRAIALLKKLCNHPLLCLPAEDFATWRSNVVPVGASQSQASQASQASQPPSQPSAPALELAPLAQGAEAASASGQHPSQQAVVAGDAEDADDGTQAAPECQHVLPRLQALIPGSVQGAALLSCKLRVLSVLLPQLHKRGHRCLIFSQSTRMLDLIQACVLRVLGLKFLRIDGTIDPKDRDAKILKFQQANSKYFCVCMSIQVGGTGLTITSADRVILVDPAWNPSVDAQAVDRVHRLGQEKPVVVYRLIGSGGIEDKMFRLQVFKRGLCKTYTEQEKQLRFFTHKELKMLFQPLDQSTSTQVLMAQQIGTEALEHEGLLHVVAEDVGSTDDPAALPFWQSSDVLGFSDYQRLFMFLETAGEPEAEDDAAQQARELAEKLRSEAYVKDQVVEGKWRAHWASAEGRSLHKHDEAQPLQGGEGQPGDEAPELEAAAADEDMVEPLPLQDASAAAGA